MSGGWARTALLALLALVALLPGTLERELMSPDEPRFALVAREMAESGDYFRLRLGGEPYLDKPPLLFWLQGLAFALFGGPSPAAARLPSLLASIVTVVLTHRAGRRWFGEPVATAGTLILVSAPLFLLRGAWVATDPLLLATTFGAVVALDRAAEGWRPGGVLAAVGLALGMLAKGPVSILWAVLAAAAAWRLPAVRYSLRPLLRPAPIAILLLVAGVPLALTAWQAGLQEGLSAGWKHTVVRFFSSWDNIEPFWFYLPKLLTGFLPWSLLGLAAALPAARRRRPPDPRRAWLVRWVLLGLALFSIPAGKRLIYLFPLFPGLALATASALPSLLESPRIRRLVGGLLTAGAVAAGVAAAWLLLSPESLAMIEAPVREPEVRRAVVALLALAGTTLLLQGLGLLGGRGRALALGAAIFAAGTGLLAPWTSRAADVGVRAERFGAAVREAIPAGTAVAFTRSKWEQVAWYAELSGPRLRRPADVARFLAGPGPRAVVGAREELGGPGEWPPGTAVALEARVGTQQMLVLRRVPEPRD